MRIRLEKRLTPSRFMQVATPIASVLLTMALGAIIFQLIGFDGPRAIYEISSPRSSPRTSGRTSQPRRRRSSSSRWACRSAIRPRSGTSARRGSTSSARLPARASRLPCRMRKASGSIPLMIAAGILGGMAWAAIPAFLRTRYRVSEVLSTLMLVYVALQVLNYLVSGPWKDPNGHNFPQTPPFTPSQLLPHAIPGTDIPPGLVVAIVLTLVFWLLTTRSVYGFSVRTVGAAPNAARYGGFDASRTIWSTLMISGGMAGLPAFSRRRANSGRSTWASPPATASPRSSFRSSAASIPSASFSRA